MRRKALVRGTAIALATTVVVVVTLRGRAALAIEQPKYEVVKRYDGFELRRYAPYLVAEVEVSGDFDDVGGQAFRILAGYIQGNNRGRADISMTAPVTQTPAKGEEISMTAPVAQAPAEGKQGTWTFSFMMPSEYTLDTLPEPKDPRIRLRRVEGRLVAARTYSGTWSEERYRKNEEALLRALRDAGLTVDGPPVFARYNAPFTPWFLRRNEVLVEIRDRAEDRPAASDQAPPSP